MLPDARSCRSASLRLIFLKNHLGTQGRVEPGGAQVTTHAFRRVLLASFPPRWLAPARTRPLLNPLLTAQAPGCSPWPQSCRESNLPGRW